MRSILLLMLLLVGCATRARDVTDCQLTVEEQNQAVQAEVARKFGEQPNGYNLLIKTPRSRDDRGRLILEGYRIYPIALPEPDERPEGRKLTVVIDPCTRKVDRVFEAF